MRLFVAGEESKLTRLRAETGDARVFLCGDGSRNADNDSRKEECEL